MHRVHLSDVTPVTSGQLELSPWQRDGHGAQWEELWQYPTCKSAEEEALYSYFKFYFSSV